MSTRKDAPKASKPNISKKKSTAVASKPSTRQREESGDRDNAKKVESSLKTKPKLVPNEFVTSNRAKPQIIKTAPQESKRTVVRKKSTVPVTPPSNRVSKTQFFPSKNMYSNVLKSEEIFNKATASSSRELKKKESEPKVKNPKSDLKKQRLVGKLPPNRNVIKKEVKDRDTFRVQLKDKHRDVSPDTSSTSERPRTATLRKGSIVNENIVGPDAPKPTPPKVIKEVVTPPSPPLEDYDYEEDFEPYESDFEEYSSSESTDLNDISDEETSSISSSNTENKESPKELTTVKKRTLSAGAEEDRKLDSGNYDMPDYKHKQVLDNIKESIEKENANLKLQEIQRNNPASLSDEGFEDQKSLQFINFLDARRKCERRKSVELKRKRGEEILNMIRLDNYSFTLFDLPSVPYEKFIESYGRYNALQVAVQTGEDDVDEAVQTNDIVNESKWTQLPVQFPKIDASDPNYLQIYRSSYLGVGHGDTSREEPGKNLVNEISLRKFMLSAGGLMLRIQVESASGQSENLQKNPRDIPFSDGYISFNTSHDFLKNSSVTCVTFSGCNSSKILTVHVYKNWDNSQGSVIGMWRIPDCEEPEAFFYSYSRVSCCSFGLDGSDFIYAGSRDGTISVWDIKRSIYNEDPNLKRIPLHTTEIGDGHDNAVISLKPFFNYAEKISGFQQNQSNEVCSLDETGDVILWNLIARNTSTKDGLLNSTNWDNVVLVRNTRVSLKTLYPELENLQCTDCVVNSMDSNYIIVSTNYGFIIHHLIKGGRSNVKKFVPASQSCANCLEACPFSPNYFLAGFSDGNINLYSRTVEKPLMVLSDKESDTGKGDVQIIQWSVTKPFVIYTKDVSNTVHVWDLSQSDIFPICSVPFEKDISCIMLSPIIENTDARKSYMVIGTDDGNIFLHLLNNEHGQQPYRVYKDHVNTFLKYVNRL